FYHNTVIMRGDRPKAWRMALFQITNAEGTVDLRNNILLGLPESSGATGSNFALLSGKGKVEASGNWISSSFADVADNAGKENHVNRGNVVGTSNDPGLVSMQKGKWDLHPKAGSPVIGKGEALPPALKDHDVHSQPGMKRGMEKRSKA